MNQGRLLGLIGVLKQAFGFEFGELISTCELKHQSGLIYGIKKFLEIWSQSSYIHIESFFT